jgi:FMN hydrolase / 5-amino-6-(5-phospho-D-ribitylamino)uracil phosphatase
MTPPTHPLAAVTFDLWATLALTDRPASAARHAARVRALLSALCEPPPPKHLDRLMLAEWAHYNAIWEAEQRTLTNPERLSWLLDQLQHPPLSPDSTSTVCAAFDASLWAGAPVLAPGAAAAIAALKAQGIKLAIISDTSYSTGQTLRRWLSENALLDAFDALTFSDEVGLSKPHPQMFLRTLAALGVPPHLAAHIGDSPRTDIAGAAAVGMRPIRYGAPDPQHAHILHFDDLPKTLGLSSHQEHAKEA